MSQSEGSIGTPGSAGAAPPPSSPAVASPSAAPPPAAAPQPVAAPGPAAPPASDAAATTPPGGAPASASTGSKTLDDVLNRYHQKVDDIRKGTEASPSEEATAAQQPPPAPQAKPAEEAPQEIEEPPTDVDEVETPEPVKAKPAAEEEAAPAEAEADAESEGDIDEILTAETLDAKYPRQFSKKAKADVLKREAHRGELLKQVNAIGGQPGVELAQSLNPIIWKADPTDEDAEHFLDLLILPENAGALKLFDKVSTHFVNQAIFDEQHGPEFASKLLTERFGKLPNGNPVDFETVSTLVEAVQSGVVNLDFVKGELATQEKPEPTARELQLQREVEELRARDATKTEETERESKRLQTQYKAQANTFVQGYVMEPILPLAEKVNWAAKQGEEGPQVGQKKTLGLLISTYINDTLKGSEQKPDPDYHDVQTMINDGSAFDESGKPTKRFLIPLGNLQNKAKARFLEIQRDLMPAFKFSAETSRNAQLVKQNGGTKHGAHQPAAPPPPAAVVQAKPEAEKTTEEKLGEITAKYRREQAEANARVGQLR